MKIYVIGDNCFHYTSCVRQALEILGNEVETMYINAFNRNSLDRIEYINYKINKKTYLKNYYSYIKHKIITDVNEFKPNIILNINANYHYEVLDKNIIEIIKQQKIKLTTWYMDSIKRIESINQHIEDYDNVFVFEPDDVIYIKEKYPSVVVHYLPIGVAQEIFSSEQNIKGSREFDISFVGSKTKNRLDILERVASYCCDKNKSMIVYGKYYENESNVFRNCIDKIKFKLQYPNLYKFTTNKLLFERDVNKLYCNTKISLNIHIDIHKGINPRTFEVLAGGNFELCDIRKDAKKLGLINGENIVFYKDADDCIRQIEYFLEHSKEREKIADAGSKLVHEKYMMNIVLKKYLDLVKLEKGIVYEKNR